MKKLGKAVVASIAAACTLFAGAGFANAGEAPSGTPSQVSVRSMYNKTRLQSAYNAVLAIANGNTARNYKQSSWMVMHSDMETARAMLNDANDGISHANGAMSQADVDNTANLLSGYPGIMQTAVPGEPTGADPLKSKGDLQAFYNRVKNVQESSYPGNENWASFRIARNSASYLFEPSHGNESQYEITLTYDNLYHATKELDPSLLPASHTPSHNPAPAPAPAPVPTPAPAPADPKTPLRNAYDKVKGYKQADFVASTWSAFAAERTAAKALLDNASATQAAINAETKSLNDKAAALINIAQLKSDIAKATSLKPSDYTEFSWYRVTLSLPYAKYVVANNNASKNDVDSAEGVLSSDLNGLKAPIAGQKTGADVPTSPKSKKDLAALVAQAEKLKESDYTADSWKVFSEALKDAKDALNPESSLTRGEPSADFTYEYVELESAQTGLVRNASQQVAGQPGQAKQAGAKGKKAAAGKKGLAKTGASVTLVASIMALLAAAGVAVKLASRKRA